MLAIIGGADGRVRLGGTVENEEHGKGIVTKITKSGKICVQSGDDDEQVIRNSPLSLWRVVSIINISYRNYCKPLSIMKTITIIPFTVIIFMSFPVVFCRCKNNFITIADTESLRNESLST